MIIKIDTGPEGPMLIILQGLHQISPKEKPYGSKDRMIFIYTYVQMLHQLLARSANKNAKTISWSASVILCSDLLIITDQGEVAWNNGKEVPRWGVAEIQKMSPLTRLSEFLSVGLKM